MATITTINANDLVKDSRSVINTNFTNLNNGLVQKTVLTVGMSTGVDYLCDGTDDHVQIQAALDAIPNGGMVFIREGTYDIGDSITMKAYQHITGVGQYTVLKAKNSLNKDMIKTPASATQRYMLFENMKIDGNRGNQTTGNAIAWFGARNSTVRNVWFTEVKGYAVYFYGGDGNLGWFNQMDRCEVDLSTGGFSTAYSEHNWFTHNTISWLDGKGAFLQSDFDYVLDNQFDHCAGYTIHVYFGAGLWHIRGNSIDRPQDDGIVIEGADKTTVLDNYFDSLQANKSAIVNNSSDQCIISRNRITQTPAGSGTYGIRETSATDKCMYVDNIITGAGTPTSFHGSSTNRTAENNIT